MIAGRARGKVRLDYHSAAERRRGRKSGACERMGKPERLATPAPFRDLLLAIAATVNP